MPAGISTPPMDPTTAGVVMAQPEALSASTSAMPRLRNFARKDFIKKRSLKLCDALSAYMNVLYRVLRRNARVRGPRGRGPASGCAVDIDVFVDGIFQLFIIKEKLAPTILTK